MRYLKKAAAVGFLVFLALWIAGIVRGLTLTFPPPPPMALPSIASSVDRDYPRNANWANNLKQIGLIETPLPVMLDKPQVEEVRVIEKRATMTTGTADFPTDESALRAAIKANQASVFNEKSAGIAPARHLAIEIGVHPDRYDSLVATLREIGRLSTITVEQKDRTEEFRKLFAQRQYLKSNLEAMKELRKGKTLPFDETLRLEQIIQGMEKELQSLTVQFGGFLGKESFYHVHMTLVEYQPGDRRDESYTIPQRVGHAFMWAVAWWFAVALVVGIIAGAGLSVWILRQKEETSK